MGRIGSWHSFRCSLSRFCLVEGVESSVLCLESVYQACRVSDVTVRVGAIRRRAFGLRPEPPMVSRPSGFNPSRLRTGSAARSACGFCGMVPATMGRTLACATACCNRLRESVPSSMLALGRLLGHEGVFTGTAHVLAGLPRHTNIVLPPVRARSVPALRRGTRPCQSQGICRVSRPAVMPG